MHNMSTRRSSVLREIPLENKEIYVSPDKKQPRRSLRVQQTKSLAISSSSESDEKQKNIETDKPSEMLFETDGVTGKDMFGFKTMKRKSAMSKRVSEVLNSSQIQSQTPIKSIKMPPVTPYVTRNKFKKKLGAMLEEMNSDDDFSPSNSEYELSCSDSSESACESNESDDSEKKEQTKPPNIRRKTEIKRDKKEFMYIMKTDDYFTQSSTKNITSNHTLQKLKNPKLSEDQLHQLLSSCNLKISHEHELGINNLLESSYDYFNKWMCLLYEGFSVLLYGLGSKQKILSTFQTEMLNDHPVIVINGYFPSLALKDIIDCILVDILEYTESVINIFEAVEIIEEFFTGMPNVHLYLIVHNIDGPMLRSSKTQNVLSSLAHIQNVHFITSVDHINTPLIWNHSKLSKFNFTWWDVTSFLPYTDETSFESSMLVQKSGALALSSLTNVFQSLTKNSRGIYMLIVKYQLDNKAIKHYQGMPFKILYSYCREHFLVSSDLALRAQLTEFLDHKLVKSKRSTDGTEQLVIPIHNSLLQQFTEQL